MEFFFEFILECVVQLFGEVILEALLRSRNPVANTIGDTVMAGLFAGLLAGLSLLVCPHHLISLRGLRIAAVVALPFLNGLLMFFVGPRFIQLGRPRGGFDHFFPAFAFSLVFGVIRFTGAA